MHDKLKNNKKGSVYFIGAGPGAPDLVTIRGQRVIEEADCVIYAGSLVNKEIFAHCQAPLYDSSTLNLDEIIDIMVDVAEKGGMVARVHTGDPSLYGAIKEQMARLDQQGIDYEVVPGVSSAFGAAATLGIELTLPEVTQSVIITRRGGRTPVPEEEHLTKLARHGATMMIFLSVGMIADVVRELQAGGYSAETPVNIVQKATWLDEKIIRGTLADIAGKVAEAKITKTALICVGKVFGDSPLTAESKLYDKHFSHGTRSADK
ncbi:MAG: precorrin-4 C(11)-methyltransferase [Desulfobacterales bacterium]|nr:precorrin-4 C(11)-methyltransferase [Desulfobacterales bacterium]